MKKLTVILFALALIFLSHPILATIGFAEWHIKTPSGHKIAHADPWKEKYGTCLMASDPSEKIFVSNIVWWQYFNNYIIGQATDSFFIFQEAEKKTAFIATESRLYDKINKLSIGSPISAKMTPQDGWDIVWDFGLAYQVKNGKDYKALSDERKELIRIKLNKYKDKVFINGEIIYLKFIKTSEKTGKTEK